MENEEQQKTLNLEQRINAIREKVDYIQKDKSVSTGAGGGSYKAVTHDAVTAMLRKHMIEQGIVCYPNFISGTSTKEEKQRFYEAVYDFVFVNMDAPVDTLTIRIQAHGMDSQDKAAGKALSYAFKYALLKLFMIETGEDEESRFKDAMSDHDVEFWILKINSLEGEAKKAAYKEAVNECRALGDVEAANRIKEGLK